MCVCVCVYVCACVCVRACVCGASLLFTALDVIRNSNSFTDKLHCETSRYERFEWQPLKHSAPHVQEIGRGRILGLLKGE